MVTELLRRMMKPSPVLKVFEPSGLMLESLSSFEYGISPVSEILAAKIFLLSDFLPELVLSTVTAQEFPSPSGIMACKPSGRSFTVKKISLLAVSSE